MFDESQEEVDVEVTLLRVTHKAYQVSYLDSKKKLKETFIPIRHIVETDCIATGDVGYVRIPKWLKDRMK